MPAAHSVCVRLGNGREIEARSVVLATGYVMPDIVQSSVHSVSSSWAIATMPQPEKIWRGRRADLGRQRALSLRAIHQGGAHHHRRRGQRRDRRARCARPPDSRKVARAGRSLAALWPLADTQIECRWAGTFDTTSDGLPLIGPGPGTQGRLCGLRLWRQRDHLQLSCRTIDWRSHRGQGIAAARRFRDRPGRPVIA